MVCGLAPHMVSVITPVNVSALSMADSVDSNRSVLISCVSFESSGLRPKPQPDKNIAAYGMGAVERLDGAGERIGRDVDADAGFQQAPEPDIARISKGKAADAERAPGGPAQLIFELRLGGE